MTKILIGEGYVLAGGMKNIFCIFKRRRENKNKIEYSVEVKLKRLPEDKRFRIYAEEIK